MVDDGCYLMGQLVLIEFMAEEQLLCVFRTIWMEAGEHVVAELVIHHFENIIICYILLDLIILLLYCLLIEFVL